MAMNLKTINAMAERRLEICRECDHWHGAVARCKLCGCFMHGKARFPRSKCPAGKWGPESLRDAPTPEPSDKSASPEP